MRCAVRNETNNFSQTRAVKCVMVKLISNWGHLCKVVMRKVSLSWGVVSLRRRSKEIVANKILVEELCLKRN